MREKLESNRNLRGGGDTKDDHHRVDVDEMNDFSAVSHRKLTTTLPQCGQDLGFPLIDANPGTCELTVDFKAYYERDGYDTSSWVSYQ